MTWQIANMPVMPPLPLVYGWTLFQLLTSEVDQLSEPKNRQCCISTNQPCFCNAFKIHSLDGACSKVCHTYILQCKAEPSHWMTRMKDIAGSHYWTRIQIPVLLVVADDCSGLGVLQFLVSESNRALRFESNLESNRLHISRNVFPPLTHGDVYALQPPTPLWHYGT